MFDEFFSRSTSGDLHSGGYIPARREWPDERDASASRLSTNKTGVGLATAHFYSLRVSGSHTTSFENSNLKGQPFLTEGRVYAPQFVVDPRNSRFTGDILSMPECTAAFLGKSLLEVTAPRIEGLPNTASLLQAIDTSI